MELGAFKPRPAMPMLLRRCSPKNGRESFLRWDLQRKLAAIIAVSLLPVVASACWLVQVSISETKEEILHSSFVTAEATEAHLSGSIADTIEVLSTLAKKPAVRSGDYKAIVPVLEDVLLCRPDLANIAVVDRSGSVYATAFGPPAEPIDISNHQYFRYVMNWGWPTVSRARLPSRSDDAPSIAIAVPLYDETGTLIGAVIGGLSLLHLHTSLAGISDAQNGDIVLVDGEGTVLVHRNWHDAAEGVNISNSPAVRAVLKGQRGTAELKDPGTGERHLVAYVPVTDTSWGLMVTYPMGKVYAAVFHAALRSFLIVLLGVSAAAGLAFVLLHWIGRPLDALRVRIRRAFDFGSGTRLEPTGNDELQQMIAAFDSLALALDSRAAQMTELRREVERRNLQLRRLSAKMAGAEVEQRKRIALDLHDSVAPLVATALLEAQQAEQQFSTDLEMAHQKIQSTLQLVRQVSSEVRCSLFELCPAGLGLGQMSAWLRSYLDHYSVVSGIHCELEVCGTPACLDSATEMAIYRILQECLHNVRKHAEATAVHCQLCFGPAMVRLVVRDNGRGFLCGVGSDFAPGHLGLMSMEERAQGVGGTIRIDSEPGRGTVVTLEVPLSSGVGPRSRNCGSRNSPRYRKDHRLLLPTIQPESA